MKLKLCLLALILTACGPASLLRRADRLTKKAIALGAVVKVDTVYITVHDTIPGVTGDTEAFRIGDVDVDTVWVDSIRLIVKHDTVNKIRYEKINVKTPTIIRMVTKPVYITKTITAPPRVDRTWRTVAFTTGGMFLLLGILLVLSSALKR